MNKKIMGVMLACLIVCTMLLVPQADALSQTEAIMAMMTEQMMPMMVAIMEGMMKAICTCDLGGLLTEMRAMMGMMSMGGPEMMKFMLQPGVIKGFISINELVGLFKGMISMMGSMAGLICG